MEELFELQAYIEQGRYAEALQLVEAMEEMAQDDGDVFRILRDAHILPPACAAVHRRAHPGESPKLAQHGTVRQVDIVQERVSRDYGFFRARLVLTNDDCLEVSEFFTVEQGQAQTIEYRHQWMDQTRQVM